MTRPLEVVAAEPSGVLAGLRAALSGDGPAIIVGAASTDLPSRVPKKIALVVETSGTTASPKRVALSGDALLASAAASEVALGGPGQWLLALPTHYIAGLNVLIRSIASGTEPVILAPGSFDPVAFADAAGRMDAELRFTSIVPAQLAQLLDEPAALAALRRFDRILVGGQSTPAPLRERALAEGIALTRTYGSSETCGGCVYDGEPIGATRVRISDGEVQLAGPTLAEGYLDDPERTEAVFLDDAGDRWYRTGDAGYLDGELLRVTGRFDDVIISGGVKVSLGDVERVVRAIRNQQDAVVTSSTSERWGDVPVVVTVVPLDRDAVRAELTETLGPAAAPDRVIIVDVLPMLPSGKPDRRAIKELAQ